MIKKSPNVVVVMPAYNAQRTVKNTYREIPSKYRKHVILVDDRSADNTVSVAKKLGIIVFAHSNNLGYGGNQKTCYWEALKYNPDVVVMLHPDYQYDATLIGDLVEPILKGKYDYMFGSRIATRGGALAGGMPKLKYFLNRIDTLLENILLGVNFSEHFSGFRAYSRKLLEKIPYQRFSNDFVFDQQMKVSAISYGMRIGEIPIPTRYHVEASSIKLFKGAKFLIDTYLVILLFMLHKSGILKSKLFK
jgi:glycosyltransferase involved in cell wall biosynthesis